MYEKFFSGSRMINKIIYKVLYSNDVYQYQKVNKLNLYNRRDTTATNMNLGYNISMPP